MKIAIDGGAFQQPIAAGIFNTAIGLMNEIRRQAPDISFTLVADPRLGSVRAEMLDLLDARPDIITAPVGPAYGPVPLPLTTTEPRVVFDVDGVLSVSRIEDGQYVYRGPPPRDSFRITSRSERPCDVGLGPDDRRLGIAISGILIIGSTESREIKIQHLRHSDGFHDPETDFRWTDGSARVPVELFPSEDGPTIVVQVRLGGQLRYRVGRDAFASESAKLDDLMGRALHHASVLQLEETLRACGVEAYIANHFIPVHFRGIRTFAILYDIIPVLFPQYFGLDARANFGHVMSVFRRAEHVFSISDASRADLIKTGGVDAGKVSSIMIDIGDEFAPVAADEVRIVLDRYGIGEQDYVLTVGTLEPRKNHLRLVEAFARAFGDKELRLVVVGKHGWGIDGLASRIAELGLSDRVVFLCNVPNADLPAIYSGALTLAYPSLYEGFGLPVLEAMACGCPVLTSDLSSMPEIAGDAAILVDPSNVEAISAGLRRIVSSTTVRHQLKELGLRRRSAFSWELSARRVLDRLKES